MSRIGRLPVVVPSGVDIAIAGQDITVKGPRGELKHTVVSPIKVETAAGKAEYAELQRGFADRGAPLRAALLAECERLLDVAAVASGSPG